MTEFIKVLDFDKLIKVLHYAVILLKKQTDVCDLVYVRHILIDDLHIPAYVNFCHFIEKFLRDLKFFLVYFKNNVLELKGLSIKMSRKVTAPRAVTFLL